MLNIKLVAWSLGLWAMLSFVICVIYGLVTPESWHMHGFLEQVLPGFKWLTWRGFSIGLVESFLYGVYGGASYGVIHNLLQSRFRPE